MFLLCYLDCSNGWLEHLFWPDIFYIHWCVNLFLTLYLDLFEYIKYDMIYYYIPIMFGQKITILRGRPNIKGNFTVIYK
jgi:hypothetical protein